MATGLLLLAAVVFVAARLGEESRPWLGYVRATAEAAMVGALADWFAVTALFRHPLGLPIPHTAIVPTRKDEIGQQLGTFVREEFITSENLTRMIADERVVARIGEAMAKPETAAAIAEQGAAVVRGAIEILDDDLVRTGLESVVVDRLKAVPVAPLAGRAVDWALEGDHHQAIIDATLLGLVKFLNDNQTVLRRRLKQESPWWVPESIDDRVFDRAYEAINRFVDEIAGNHGHELRLQLDSRMLELAGQLKESAELVKRGEEFKAEILANEDVRQWIATLWDRIKAAIVTASFDDGSELRHRLVEAIAEAGERLSVDPELSRRVEGWIAEAVSYTAEQGGGAIERTIASTVERWDAAQTSDLIESRVGRDLQFIRINGTLVGGFVGLLLYTFSQALA